MDERLALALERSGHAGMLRDEKVIETIIAVQEALLDKFLERGDIRILVLEALASGPKHGYGIMEAISVRFDHLYKPSPGVIYPTLQALCDEGLISCDEKVKKKDYALGKKGEKELAKFEKRLDEISAQFKECAEGGAFAERMKGITPLWIELAYNVFFRPKSKLEDKNTEKRFIDTRKVLKRALEDIEGIWK
jgi:DNA-binding PadR family transcriptional regulator